MFVHKCITVYDSTCTHRHMHTHSCNCWLPCHPQMRKVFRKKNLSRCHGLVHLGFVQAGNVLWSWSWNNAQRMHSDWQDQCIIMFVKSVFWKKIHGPLKRTMELETKMWTPVPAYLLYIHLYHCIFWMVKFTEVMHRLLWRITKLFRIMVSNITIIICYF